MPMVPVELLLRDQHIAGGLVVHDGRVLDRFNGTRDDSLIVHQATARSLHYLDEGRPIDSARVRKARILLAVPHDAPPTGPPARNKLWVERRPVAVELAVGPFVLSGTMHVSPREPLSLEELGRDDAGRAFIPITRATIRVLYGPDPLRDSPVVFALAAGIDALRLLPAPSP